MELVRIYECFCDETRLRILNLISRGPLCVCHFQEILDLPQVKVSKHLAYLRKRKMVATKRVGTWVVYRLAEERSQEFEQNLRCLQDCVASDKSFRKDLLKLKKVVRKASDEIASELRPAGCCPDESPEAATTAEKISV